MSLESYRMARVLPIAVFFALGLCWIFYMDHCHEEPKYHAGDTVSCLFTSRTVGLGEEVDQSNTVVEQTVIDAPGFECIPNLYIYKGRHFGRDLPEGTRVLPSMISQ